MNETTSLADSLPRSRRRPWRAVLLLLLLLAAGGGAWAYVRAQMEPAAGTEETTRDRTVRLERGSFPITVLAKGNLDAIERHDIAFEGTGRFGLKILEVVEDRAVVEKEDVVVRFDPEKYEAEARRLRLELEENRKNLLLAEEDLAIARADNLANVKKAIDGLRTARDARTKYEDLESPKQKEALAAKVTEAEAALETAREKVATAEAELSAAAMKEEEDRLPLQKKLEEAEREEAKARVALDEARKNYRVFRRYDDPEKRRALREGAVQARLQLQRTLVQAKSRIIKEERGIQNLRERIAQTKNELETVVADLDRLVLRAPAAGIVALGNPNRPHWRAPKEIKVGVDCAPREIVATIPDLSSFMVKCNIPEAHRSRIREGQRATLESAAVPDLEMRGELTKIAPMAASLERWNPNSPKVYAVEISTDSSDARLRPGMTVDVEIYIETVEDALLLPVEAVYSREGKTVCRVLTPAGPVEREVETGRASTHFVEILGGVKAGAEVLLHRPEAEAEA